MDTARALPPLALTRDQWTRIGVQMGWEGGADTCPACSAKTPKTLDLRVPGRAPLKVFGTYGTLLLTDGAIYGPDARLVVTRDGHIVSAIHYDTKRHETFTGSQTDAYDPGDEGWRVYERVKAMWPEAVLRTEDSKVRLRLKGGERFEDMARIIADLHDNHDIEV